MNEEQAMVDAMLRDVLKGWANGTVPALFPIEPEDRESPAGMIWKTSLNVLAYGLDQGMEMGMALGRIGS